MVHTVVPSVPSTVVSTAITYRRVHCRPIGSRVILDTSVASLALHEALVAVDGLKAIGGGVRSDHITVIYLMSVSLTVTHYRDDNSQRNDRQ